MYEPLKRFLLKVLSVPPEPDAPLGAPQSVRVFRAAPNYYRYRLLAFLIGQGVVVLSSLVGAAVFVGVVISEGGGGAAATLTVIGAGLFLAFILFQALLGFALLRLDYEMRWYILTDRALRIREGVWNIREMTMSFANIQNIEINQGPLQRYFGIADLKVQSAGGGGGVAEAQQAQAGAINMHLGYFRGVDNAEEIRDLMRERLRRLKDTGLGDPESDQQEHESPDEMVLSPTAVPWHEVIHELRHEARQFHHAADLLRKRLTGDAPS